MKVDISQPILNFDGEPLTNPNGEAVTFGFVFRNLLGGASQKDNGDKKLKKFNIGLKCVADEVDLTIDEAKIIKDLAEENGVSNIVYGRICQLLEGDED